jgi:hypothetical protein
VGLIDEKTRVDTVPLKRKISQMREENNRGKETRKSKEKLFS